MIRPRHCLGTVSVPVENPSAKLIRKALCEHCVYCSASLVYIVYFLEYSDIQGCKGMRRSTQNIPSARKADLNVQVHAADMQDRDGATDIIHEVLEQARTVSRPWVDGGYRGAKPVNWLVKLEQVGLLKIAENPRIFATSLCSVVVWPWRGPLHGRHSVQDFERSVSSSLTWALLAVYRYLMRRPGRMITA